MLPLLSSLGSLELLSIKPRAFLTLCATIKLRRLRIPLRRLSTFELRALLLSIKPRAFLTLCAAIKLRRLTIPLRRLSAFELRALLLRPFEARALQLRSLALRLAFGLAVPLWHLATLELRSLLFAFDALAPCLWVPLLHLATF